MQKLSRQRHTGFTMVELMTVIVILGILVAVSVPYMLGAQERAKIAGVKENMHLVQLMAETYSTDWSSSYPVDGSWLEFEAQQKGYWKNATNPFTLSTNYLFSMNPSSDAVPLGAVGYRVQSDFSVYGIYGCDGEGNLLKADGQVLVLTNGK